MPKTKTAKPLPKIEPLPGAVCRQWKRCNRGGCKCNRGTLHGPYLYRMWREDGRLHKQYIKLSHADGVTAACIAYRQEQAEQRRLNDYGRMTCRQLIKRLREMGYDQ